MRKLSPVLLLATFLACTQTLDEPKVVRQQIQGGTQTGTTGHPNVVAIMINGATGGGICSGTLIARNLVLTAHHCVAPTINNMCSANSFGANYALSSFAVTPSPTLAAQFFNSGFFPTVNNFSWFGVNAIGVPSNNICGGDIAVLQLSAPITNVCPAIPRVDIPVTTNEQYTAVGFGVTSPTGTAAGTRYAVSGMVVQCPSNCGGGTSAALEWVGGSSLMRGVCEGDSGGPAKDSLGRVTGTVSRGPGTACNQAVYESVYGHGNWIKQMATAAAMNGGYTRAGWVTGGATSNPNNGYCGTGGGAGGGSGGGGGTQCPMNTICADATGNGNYQCLDPNTINGFPPNAPSCSQTMPCAAGSTCWLASMGATTGSCLVNCSVILPDGGMSGTGGGGGSNLPGRGSCSSAAWRCFDATGQGDYVCLDPTTPNGFPAGAPVCSGTMACPAGNSCWLQMQGATSGNCLENCIPDGGTAGGAAGGSGSAGGTGTGGSGGSGATCPIGQTCVNANGMGSYACIDPTTGDGFPANAPACNPPACPAGYGCWVNSMGTMPRCLQSCGGTAGGSGGTAGGTGGTAGGTGGTAGGATAGGATAGGATAGGATAGGATAGGATGTAGGTTATAGGATGTAGGTGGTAGGDTAGGASGTAGGDGVAGGDGAAGGDVGAAGGSASAGSGGTAGGETEIIPGGTCGCTQGGDVSTLALALLGLLTIRRSRRRTA